MPKLEKGSKACGLTWEQPAGAEEDIQVYHQGGRKPFTNRVERGRKKLDEMTRKMDQAGDQGQMV